MVSIDELDTHLRRRLVHSWTKAEARIFTLFSPSAVSTPSYSEFEYTFIQIHWPSAQQPSSTCAGCEFVCLDRLMWCVWLLSVLAAICFRHDGVTENSWSHCGWVWSGLVGGWSSTMCGLRDYSTRTEPQQRRSQTPKVVIYTFYLIGVNHTCCASLAQQNTCLFMQRIKGVLCLCV